MRALSAPCLLNVWERGLHQAPVERALTLLSVADPGTPREDLATLSLGQRDAALLALREETFGRTLRGSTKCPRCGQVMEFTLATADIRARAEPELELAGDGPQFEAVADDIWLRFRLLNSTDLAAIAGCQNTAVARRLLAKRCVLGARRGGMKFDVDELPEQAIELLASRLAECDPQAEVLLAMRCAACGHEWQMIFDIAAFLWAEIGALARRLLHQVHILARNYGWSEAEILAMSAARRQFYLEMAGNG